MIKKSLSLCFKGARNYMHGTDMVNQAYSAVMETLAVAQVDAFRFVIHRMTGSRLALELRKGEGVSVAVAPVATMTFKAKGRPCLGVIVEDEGRPDCRYPYDEDSIVKACVLDREARNIVLQEESPFTPIETVVAMTKFLHLAVFPDAPGKWVFCRWESEHWPLSQKQAGLSVSLGQTLGTRLTRSEVCLDGEVLGQVFFSAKVNQ